MNGADRMHIASRVPWIEVTRLALVLVLAAACFQFFGNSPAVDWRWRSIFFWINVQWMRAGSDFSHGWLMPLFSLWAVWRVRRELLAAPKRVDLRGLALVALSLLLHLASYRSQQPRFSLMAVVGVLWGIPLYLYGPAVARLLAFPAAYLLLCFTSSLLFYATFHLRLLSTILASGLLNGLGIEVIRNGTAILSAAPGGFQLDVADPCSGLRSLYVMTALAAPYAYLAVPRRSGGWLLMALSIPLAVLANVVRIVSLAFVAEAAGMDLAMRLYHDFSGYLMFGISVLLLTSTAAAINRLLPGRPGNKTAPRHADGGSGSRNRGAAYAALTSLLAGTMALLWIAGPARFDADPGIRTSLPDRLGEYTAVDYLYCQDAKCLASFRAAEVADRSVGCQRCGGKLDDVTLGENTLLPAGTLVVRRGYEATGLPPVHVSAVVADRDSRSIHKPQVCLVAQGYSILNQKVVPVPITGRPPLPVMFLSVVPTQGNPTPRTESVYAYWFVSKSRQTPHHATRLLWTTWDGVIHGVREAWAYVAVAATGPNAESARATAVRFISELYPLLQPPDAAAVSEAAP